MTKREEDIARLVYTEVRNQALAMTWDELILMKQVYAQRLHYDDLPEKTRARFRNVGIEFLKKLPNP